MSIVEWDRELQRVYLGNDHQRLHHGPVALGIAVLLTYLKQYVAATLFYVWAYTDLHDWRVWFTRGPGK